MRVRGEERGEAFERMKNSGRSEEVRVIVRVLRVGYSPPSETAADCKRTQRDMGETVSTWQRPRAKECGRAGQGSALLSTEAWQSTQSD